ncbi:MAG: CotH kinase family protein [Cyclobacteriaceae bacterium]
MKMYSLIIITLIVLGSTACRNDDLSDIISEDNSDIIVDIETPDWTETTHSNAADPDFETVFPNDMVHRIDISISAESWSSMQSDLAQNMGSTGGRPGGPGGGGADIDFTPIWVPCSFNFEGKEWYKAGIRYKGNSTLRNAYQSGTDKFPFKLDFDEFEDTYPAIENQRFYGFKQLNLSNNYSDGTAMREKVAADLFREFGIPAAHTAFAAVYLDRGNGSVFIGMYTLVEEVDDTVIDTQFSNLDGNLYKPDGTGASFASGTYNTADMDKKNNEDANDYSDIRALYDVLHSDIRTSNPNQWQSDLESAFDVNHFLKYLAANNVIQNWDTYGNMTHNYFLYNQNGLLIWIPWDNNEAFQDGKMGGSISLSTAEVGSNWPIIAYIMGIPEYQAVYNYHLSDFTSGVFEVNKMNTLYTNYENLITEYAQQEIGSFSSYVQQLKSHASDRNQAVINYLN